MPAEDAVIDSLLAGVAGQIAACNMVASVQRGLVRPAMVADVFAMLAKLAAREDFARSTDAVGALLEIRDGEWPDVDPGGVVAAMWLAGNRPAADDDFVGGVTTVTGIPVLRRLLGAAEERFMAQGLTMAASTTDPESAEDVAFWQRCDPALRRFRVDPDATLGRPDEVLWFTRRQAFADGLRPEAGSGSAQRARDLLGLDKEVGEVLVAVHFPAAALRGSARPTFFDGIAHSRFRAWPDGREAQADMTWGRTVDLRAFEDGAESMDGIPERVAPPVPGDRSPGGIEAEFEMLGRVERETGTDATADAEFAARLAAGQGLTVDDLAARLKAIVRDRRGGST